MNIVASKTRFESFLSIEKLKKYESNSIVHFLACIFNQIRYYALQVADIAQLVEQLTCNQ